MRQVPRFAVLTIQPYGLLASLQDRLVVEGFEHPACDFHVFRDLPFPSCFQQGELSGDGSRDAAAGKSRGRWNRRVRTCGCESADARSIARIRSVTSESHRESRSSNPFRRAAPRGRPEGLLA